MFENIPPWAMQQRQQGQGFNPAPMIMSPYQHGQTMAPQLPPIPQAPQDQSGMTSSMPQGLGGLQSILGTPGQGGQPGQQGSLQQLLAVLQRNRAPAPSGTGLPPQIDNQMSGYEPSLAGGTGSGGFFGNLLKMFGG